VTKSPVTGVVAVTQVLVTQPERAYATDSDQCSLFYRFHEYT
jgi:hypothetical protein